MSIFDYEKSVKTVFDYMENMVGGVEKMISVSADQIRSDELEKEEVMSIGKMKLFHYVPVTEKKKTSKVPLLIVYALVNRQYMMDLQPDRSVIKAFLEAGLDVYIIDWGYPAKEDMYMTMEDHIEWYMNDCVDYIRKASGQDKISMLGVCQGGTFSTIYTALHQENIKNLVCMVAPIDFSITDGILFRFGKEFSIDKMVEAYGNIPADMMNLGFMMLKPFELFIDKYIKFGQNMNDVAYLQNFMRTENWIYDSPDQEGETLRKFVNDFYVDNKLIKGEFELDGVKVHLENINCPLLVTCAKYDHLVPPSSTKPLLDAVRSKDKDYREFPVGHVGMYISPTSKTEIAPVIAEWLVKRS